MDRRRGVVLLWGYRYVAQSAANENIEIRKSRDHSRDVVVLGAFSGSGEGCDDRFQGLARFRGEKIQPIIWRKSATYWLEVKYFEVRAHLQDSSQFYLDYILTFHPEIQTDHVLHQFSEQRDSTRIRELLFGTAGKLERRYEVG